MSDSVAILQTESARKRAAAFPLGPTTSVERIPVIDVLRGIALLGILAMNIYIFAMPSVAYTNPFAYGGTSELDFAAWIITYLLFRQKSLLIFSMLFGGSLVLMTRRARTLHAPEAGLYYRRIAWLMLIGAAHAYLIWAGDILVPYAICALLLFPARRLKPRSLLALGFMVLTVGLILSTATGFYFSQLKQAAIEAENARATGQSLTEEQKKALENWEANRSVVSVSQKQMAAELNSYRSSYAEILKHRAPEVFASQTLLMIISHLWRLGGFMLIGMALLKFGILSGERSVRSYAICVSVGYGLGLPLEIYNIHNFIRVGFDGIYYFKTGVYFDLLAIILVTFGHIGTIMLLYKKGIFSKLLARFAMVGRMALSNYLLQSFICTTIFYGYGLGLFGSIRRSTQMLFVVAIWVVQLVVSSIWLRHFRFGPMEWLWRSLTYWAPQPLLINQRAKATLQESRT